MRRAVLATALLLPFVSVASLSDRALASTTFGPPVRLISSCGGPSAGSGACPEPTITVDRNGWLYVMSYSARDIAVIHDGVVEHRAGPGPVLPSFGDAMIGSDGAGQLFITGLQYPLGVGVWRSSDRGRTWNASTVVTLPDADRSWLAFGPNGRVHLLYLTIGGEVVQTSTDGGATFGAPTLLAPPGRSVDYAGAPLVDAAGRLLVPVVTSAADFATPPDLRLAVSADGGRTFSYPTIAVSSSGAGVVWGFPALAEARDHVLHAAWVTPLESGLQDVVVASSSDGGATWAAPVSWSGPDTLTAGPGIAAGDGVLNVAWYRVTAPGQSSSLIFAHGRPDGSSVERTVVVDGIVARPSTPAPTNEANTDFAAFALLPDGRAAIVWSDNGVWLSVENATHRECR